MSVIWQHLGNIATSPCSCPRKYPLLLSTLEELLFSFLVFYGLWWFSESTEVYSDFFPEAFAHLYLLKYRLYHRPQQQRRFRHSHIYPLSCWNNVAECQPGPRRQEASLTGLSGHGLFKIKKNGLEQGLTFAPMPSRSTSLCCGDHPVHCRMLAASLASTHWIPVAPSQSWQSKMSLGGGSQMATTGKALD